MKKLTIKTVEALVEYYNTDKLWGWVSIDNLDRNNSEQWRTKRPFHEETFEKCSRGTQIALINDFIFDGERYRIGRTGFTHPNCEKMLDAYLKELGY